MRSTISQKEMELISQQLTLNLEPSTITVLIALLVWMARHQRANCWKSWTMMIPFIMSPCLLAGTMRISSPFKKLERRRKRKVRIDFTNVALYFTNVELYEFAGKVTTKGDKVNDMQNQTPTTRRRIQAQALRKLSSRHWN
jgi:hypothetical protein